MPGNCSDKEPYFLPDYQGNTAFVLFYRDARGYDIPAKKRRFLSEISVTHATPCRDNLPSKHPDFWKNANNHTIRDSTGALRTLKKNFVRFLTAYT